MRAFRADMQPEAVDGTTSAASDGGDPGMVLGAVREDIRQTLRTAWIDPAFDFAAEHPVFFTAAWSAIRPNVGRSFVSLARTVRSEAADTARSMRVPDLRKRLNGELSGEVIGRVEECVRAAHLSMAKAQIVVHALHRVGRRERISGTGREEPPIRRGVPDWQRWMSIQPAPESVRPLLDQAAERFGLPAAPSPLRLLARWPSVLEVSWTEMQAILGTPVWRSATSRIRRLVLGGIGKLPHPIDLQWTALRARGFGEEERQRLVQDLSAHDAAMPGQTLAAAALWVAFGSPDVGPEP